MLEKQNIDSSKSETLHFPNVSTMMKISFGLILFTMISTVLVYAEISDDAVVTIVKNGHLENNSQYLDNTLFSSSPGSTITVINNDIVSHMLVSGIDNTLFSSSPGSTITVINNDVVSHMLVSGSANSNRNSNINYDDFLVCEFDPNDDQSVSNQDDNNACDFNKDNRIITEIIPPGASASFTLNELGTYRIIDSDYPWIEFVIYSFPTSDSSNNVNSSLSPTIKFGELVNVTLP